MLVISGYSVLVVGTDITNQMDNWTSSNKA